MGLDQVALLHADAITAGLVGFVTGPPFMYYSTSSIADSYSPRHLHIHNGVRLLTAVILSFLGRIFIVREDVRIKFSTTPPLNIGTFKP